MGIELFKKYRPKDFDEMVGQDHVIKPLTRMFEKGSVPHTILLCGPKGSGKTTLSQIIRKRLGCSKFDFNNQDCGQDGGIVMVREIQKTLSLAPLKGKFRIWVLNEAQNLNRHGQEGLLDMCEFTPKHVYFILCTTEPQRLSAPLRSRCTTFALKALDCGTLTTLVQKVCKAEGIDLCEQVCDKIVENADGSARTALVLLNTAMVLDNKVDQLAAINVATAEAETITIARLLFKPGTQWPEMAATIKAANIEDSALEGVRRLILSYAASVLLGGGNLSGRAHAVIAQFGSHWYDCGRAGLIDSCWSVIAGK